VLAKIDEFRALLAGPACGEEPLAKSIRKSIKKKVKKAQKALDKADDATKDALIATLLGKAGVLLQAAQDRLASAVAAGQLSPSCGGVLHDFIADIQFCTDGLPQPPA